MIRKIFFKRKGKVEGRRRGEEEGGGKAWGEGGQKERKKREREASA